MGTKRLHQETKQGRAGGPIFALHHSHGGWPSIRAKAVVKDRIILAVFETPVVARGGRGPRLWNITLNHFSVEDRSTNHRYGLNLDHDSSIRTSRPLRMRGRPINHVGLACADPDVSRAALDANDLRIRRAGCAASSRVVRPTCVPPPPWPHLWPAGGSVADTVCEIRDQGAPRRAPLPPASRRSNGCPAC